jgi:hypothetical protein
VSARRQLATRIAAAALLAFAVVTAPALTIAAPEARAGTLWMTSCSGFGDGANDVAAAGMVWEGISGGDFSTSNRCPQGGSFQILPSNPPKTGENVQWHTVTPPSIEIVHAVTPVNEVLIDPNLSGDGFKASFFWNGGSQTIWPVNNCCGGMYYGAGINTWLGPSRYFGWQVTCQASPCGAPYQILDVRGVELVAVDNAPPSLVALGSNNLWYQGGRWVRGAGWPASFQASADDGICGMQAIIDGQSIQGPSDPFPNQHSWTQCPDPQTMGLTIDTSQYPDGPMSLLLSARDAASPANVSWPSETLHVDNTPVGLTLSGPTDAPSTAGTQYITASASAGPSGVSIACSLDGSPYQWYSSATVQIPVSGLGPHTARCYGQNGAIDPQGVSATSQVESWTLYIREPTVIGASFAHIADALRCHKARERVRIPAHWVTGRYHGQPVQVKLPAQTRTIKVERCHPRIVRRRIRVHGGWRTVRVPVPPHVVAKTIRRIAFGARTTISGWLGTASGTALGGQAVRILTAADNGLQHFRQAAVTSTAADGAWTAKLPPGPSRLIEAVYDGTSTTEPASSSYARVVVPASVNLRIRPLHVRWGGRITITGRLRGGYVPPFGEALSLSLNYNGRTIDVQHIRTGRNGRFRTTYTFLGGAGSASYPFWVTTIPESDFPWAVGSSRKIFVTVAP